jgi:hypothetical protein
VENDHGDADERRDDELGAARDDGLSEEAGLRVTTS